MTCPVSLIIVSSIFSSVSLKASSTGAVGISRLSIVSQNILQLRMQ